MKTLTLTVPDQLYAHLTAASQRVQRPLNDLVMEAIAAIGPVVEHDSVAPGRSLSEMALFNDAALWRAARSTMTPEQRDRLADLHDKAQDVGLTSEERAEENALVSLYRETLLIRAQAATLLAHRGYDVADPTQFGW